MSVMEQMGNGNSRRLDVRSNTYDLFKKGIIGFDRTTGQGIYGDVPWMTGGNGQGWLDEQQAKYEKERVKSESSQSSFSGIKDVESLAAIKQALLTTSANGNNVTSQKGAMSQQVADIDAQLADYTKKAAFTDAAALIQQSLNKTMESQRPQITKAIEGSGTSASSMQALLAQKLASQASLDAGALGAEQAKAYGNITAQLLGTQGKLVTDQQSLSSQYASDIAKLGDLMKVSESNTDAKSYFSAEEMNPKDSTGGKYGNPGAGKGYNLSRSNWGYY